MGLTLSTDYTGQMCAETAFHMIFRACLSRGIGLPEASQQLAEGPALDDYVAQKVQVWSACGIRSCASA
eukprot:8908088-Alexandrium_andersonii.AAC.1